VSLVTSIIDIGVQDFE